MAKYNDDRNFTDFVHQNIAIPQIYKKLGWTEYHLDKTESQKIDIEKGIDYLFYNRENKTIKVQERFREESYKKYNDCTLRYKREHNSHADRLLSEYFKLQADVLVYGITNGTKPRENRHTVTSFIKCVLIDLNVLYKQISLEKIIFDTTIYRSKIVGGRMIAPINKNSDDSSSFVAFDIKQLHKLFGNENIIICQKGYFQVCS